MGGTRINPVHQAVNEVRAAAQEAGRELRLARIGAGLTQRAAAARLGWSQSRVSRVERGRYRHATPEDLARFAGVVGMRVVLRVLPGGRRMLDAPQLSLLEQLHRRVHPGWSWELEVSMPCYGDLRAADCRLARPGCSVMVEAITRLADGQAQMRSARRKHADLGTGRLVLLVAETRANRRAWAEARGAMSAAFPIPGRGALRRLAHGEDPLGDSVIFLPITPKPPR